MPDFVRGDVIISLPLSLTVADPERASRVVAFPAGPEMVVDALSPEHDELLRGLVSAGIEVVAVQVQPTETATDVTGRASALRIEQPVEVEVPVPEGES